MKLFQAAIDIELQITQALSRERNWRFWTDQRNRRDPEWPTILALHTSTLCLAIYARTRQPYPSDQLRIEHVPTHWNIVVWHPKNLTDAARWLNAPIQSPAPGLVTRVIAP